jgi:hypothetical protein
VTSAAIAETSGDSMRRWAWDGDVELGDDSAGAAGEQDDAVAEAGGFAHVVGDEHDREVLFGGDAFDLVVEDVAGDRVERTEWFVHEQDVGALPE